MHATTGVAGCQPQLFCGINNSDSAQAQELLGQPDSGSGNLLLQQHGIFLSLQQQHVHFQLFLFWLANDMTW
jgi:hypothetical protein